MEQQRQLRHNLTADPCASTTNFGPSPKTIAAFQHRLNAFTRQALPFYGVRVPGVGADVSPSALTFQPAAMNQVLDPFFPEYRKKILEFLGTHPLFKNKHMTGMTVAEQRQLVLDQVKVISSCGLFRFKDIVDDPLRYVSFMESLYYHGANVATKAGVHYGLFGNTVMNLGTAEHTKMADQIQTLEVRGSFALTELGHGSNARDIETKAVYDEKTQEFVLSTPTETAQKMWIGNVGMHGNHAVVFAQLYVAGKHEGVHVFLVRIRDDNGKSMPGIRLLDCGTKSGLNGVDNGRIWFDNTRIPRKNLLDKYGGVGADGKYTSPIPNQTKRFITMIAALVGGRLVVAQGAVQMAKVGLTVAIRYALTRKQFGPPGEPEIVLLDYLGHQRRLFPLLAKTYALQFASNHVKRLFMDNRSVDAKELHILASGLKPAATWHRVKVLQECREACGGMGFHASNRIGALRNDADIDVTWEGDNHVLLQQISANLLKELQTQISANKGFEGIMSYYGRQMEMEIRDKNIVKKFYSSEDHLTDYDFFKNALEYREARLLRALVNKTRKTVKTDPFASWNNANDLVEELAIASTERQIVEQFIAGIKKANTQLQPILHVLCSLYALSVIQDHMGWYMTFRYFSPPKSKAIWNEINKLCGMIRPHAKHLVDAFGIPESLLDAPIAGDWIGAFSYPNIPSDFGAHAKL